MGQQKQVSTLWSCDRVGCDAQRTSYDPNETPQGWLSIVGAYQDQHGGGPARLDLCSKHASIFRQGYILRNTDDIESLQG